LPLNDPIVSGIAEIAAYLYGANATPKQQRRVRHLIRTGQLPAKLIGGRLEARCSWLDSIYDKPDPPRRPLPEPEANGHLVDIGVCAREGCSGRVLKEGQRSGRPPRYCELHRDRKNRTQGRAA